MAFNIPFKTGASKTEIAGVTSISGSNTFVDVAIVDVGDVTKARAVYLGSAGSATFPTAVCYVQILNATTVRVSRTSTGGNTTSIISWGVSYEA